MKLLGRCALLLLLASASVALAPGSVLADPEPEVSSEPEEAPAPTRDRWNSLLAVEGLVGMDTPYGLLGLAGVVSPHRNVAFDLGGGVSRDGGRFAGGVRLVLPHENAALGFRLGMAGGPLGWDTPVASPNVYVPAGSGTTIPSATQTRVWNFTAFVDLSISLEWRFDMGLYIRMWFGAEHTLVGADSCTQHEAGSTASTPCPPGGFGPTRSFVGLAVGYAFQL